MKKAKRVQPEDCPRSGQAHARISSRAYYEATIEGVNLQENTAPVGMDEAEIRKKTTLPQVQKTFFPEKAPPVAWLGSPIMREGFFESRIVFGQGGNAAGQPV
jgi:hypothetical protein